MLVTFATGIPHPPLRATVFQQCDGLVQRIREPVGAEGCEVDGAVAWQRHGVRKRDGKPGGVLPSSLCDGLVVGLRVTVLAAWRRGAREAQHDYHRRRGACQLHPALRRVIEQLLQAALQRRCAVRFVLRRAGVHDAREGEVWRAAGAPPGAVARLSRALDAQHAAVPRPRIVTEARVQNASGSFFSQKRIAATN